MRGRIVGNSPKLHRSPAGTFRRKLRRCLEHQDTDARKQHPDRSSDLEARISRGYRRRPPEHNASRKERSRPEEFRLVPSAPGTVTSSDEQAIAQCISSSRTFSSSTSRFSEDDGPAEHWLDHEKRPYTSASSTSASACSTSTSVARVSVSTCMSS